MKNTVIWGKKKRRPGFHFPTHVYLGGKKEKKKKLPAHVYLAGKKKKPSGTRLLGREKKRNWKTCQLAGLEPTFSR